MKTPFTKEQFLNVFSHYNLDVYPMQLVFYLLAIAAVYMAVKPFKNSDRMITGILSFFWMWMGVVYHLIYFTPINSAAFLFGALFILQGTLLFYRSIVSRELSFSYRRNKVGNTGLILILYALVLYPAVGYFMEHYYPAAPTFGLPCPTTIFTFGLLLMTDKKLPLTILIIPFAWSIIGVSAAISFGIIEDFGLLIAGLIAVPMLIIHNRKYSRNAIGIRPVAAAGIIKKP